MRINDRNLVLIAGLAILVPGLFGCGSDEIEIRRYQVPHETAPASFDLAMPAGTARRTLAAIIPRGNQAWFFKVTGPAGQVRSAEDDFQQLVQSVRFDADQPLWETPGGWTRSDGDPVRYATLSKGGAEITVIRLPQPEGDLDAYVLLNVNRWREQLAMPPVTADQLPEMIREIQLVDGSGLLFDSGEPQNAELAPSTPAAAPQDGLVYEVPESWQKQGPRPMRLATFTVNRDGKSLEITLSQLGPNPGSLENNVNRWRSQVGLSDAEAPAIQDDLKSIAVDGVDCDYIQIVGAGSNQPGEAIYAVIIKRPDRTVFVKLKGDARLAGDEAQRFEEFVRSIRFS